MGFSRLPERIKGSELESYFGKTGGQSVVEVPVVATLSGAPVSKKPDGSYRTVTVARPR